LKEFIYHNIELGFPPTIEMIERAAGEIIQRKKARQLGLPRTNWDAFERTKVVGGLKAAHTNLVKDVTQY
jgi:hypothetical protein